ncbi:MAG: DUF4976 domain-containing protein [Bacteroidales bacterium]
MRTRRGCRWSLFRGDTATWRDALSIITIMNIRDHMAKRHYGIRTERYKLMHFYNDIDEWELHDLQSDPMELKNVIDDPSYTLIRENSW